MEHNHCGIKLTPNIFTFNDQYIVTLDNLYLGQIIFKNNEIIKINLPMNKLDYKKNLHNFTIIKDDITNYYLYISDNILNLIENYDELNNKLFITIIIQQLELNYSDLYIQLNNKRNANKL